MSFSQIRRRGTANTRINQLVRQFQNFQAHQVQLDNINFRTKNRPVRSRLKYHDPFLQGTVKDVNTVFYMPLEPDGKVVCAYWKLDHHGRYFLDSSGMANHVTIVGNPILKIGIDNGYGRTLYPFFDDNNRGFISDLQARNLLNTSAFRTGFTLTCRIYPESILDPSVNQSKFRVIASKHDTVDGTEGWNLSVIPDGSIRFTIKRKGVNYSVTTAAGVINVNTSLDPVANYDIVVKVPITSDVPSSMKIYVNNIGYTTVSTSHLDLISGDTGKYLRFGALFPIDNHNDWYKFYGGIQDFRIYREYLLSDTEVASLYTNKLTIRDIPNGKIALAGMGVFTDQVSYFGGFDTTGFDSTGFDTT